jgi:hypothetical protein
MKRVISLHGIRTRGDWQKALAPLLAEQGFVPHPLDFGWFTALGLLVPPIMKKKLEWLRSEYEWVVSRDPKCRPSVVAHSFGSWLVANLIDKYPQVRFDKVILMGSIVDRNFDWKKVIDRGQINFLRNDYGEKDIWPRAAGLFGYKCGASGCLGFISACRLIEQKPFEQYSHSTYFTHLHFSEEWIPVLKQLVLHAPSKRVSFLLDEKSQKSIVDFLNIAAKNSARKLGVDASRIRSNIFIESEINVLSIPPGLHYNMKNSRELGITIPVGQGCSGQSYKLAQRAWAVLKGDWGEHALPDEQLELVDRDLRWVVSTPIPMERKGKVEVVGIFNIDGLKEEKSRQDLVDLERPSDDLFVTAKTIGDILLKGVLEWD